MRERRSSPDDSAKTVFRTFLRAKKNLMCSQRTHKEIAAVSRRMFLAVGSHPAPRAQTTVTAQIAQMCAARLVISARKFRDANSVNIGQRTDGVPAAWRGNLPFLRSVSTSNRTRYFSQILRGNARRQCGDATKRACITQAESPFFAELHFYGRLAQW